MKVRFYCAGFDNPTQDHDREVLPRQGEHVELPAPDGQPLSFIVAEVHHICHEVIPADAVVVLIPAPMVIRKMKGDTR